MRALSRKVMAFATAFVMIFSFLLGSIMLPARASAADTGASAGSGTVRLYFYYEGNATLYMNIWNHTGLEFAEGVTTSSDFGWGHAQGILNPVKDGENYYSIDLKIRDKTAAEGFTIYAGNSSTEVGKIDSGDSWYGPMYTTLVSGKQSAYLYKEWKLMEDISEVPVTNEEKDNDKEEDKSGTKLPADLSSAIRGIDVSSYYAMQESFDAMNTEAGKEIYGYKNFDGKIIKNQDFFNFLADQGVNYIRLRVWNDPYTADGKGYGGGNSDLNKAKVLGQYATKAGMKVLIDFHLSDLWTDPGKQQAPKAWKNYTAAEKATAVSTFITSSLNELLDAGVDVGMVQVGNETNNGVSGESNEKSWNAVNAIFDAGCDAVHSVAAAKSHNMLAVVHFTNPETGNEQTFAKNLSSYDNGKGVSYDVFATSYYPFFHGSLDNLYSVLRSIANTYGKKVMVAETSYPYSLKDYDGHDNQVRKGNNDTGENMNWPINKLGQAQEFQAVEKTVRSIADKKGEHVGLGAFYWEGAWISLYNVSGLEGAEKEAAIAKNKALWEKYGSGWAASYGREYDPKDAGQWYGGSAVDNQCFFGPDGKPLQSITTFSENYTDFELERTAKNAVCDETVDLRVGATLADIVLPKATILYDDESEQTTDVTWNEADIQAINAAAQDDANTGKSYTLTGTCSENGKTFTVKCIVKLIYRNLLENPSFENGGTGWKVAEGSTGLDSKDGLVSPQNKTADAKSGNNAAKFWAKDPFAFSFSSETTISKAGKYQATIYAQGGADDGGTVQLTVSIGDKTYASDAKTLNGYVNWVPLTVDFTVTDQELKANNVVTFTISAKDMAAGAWGTIDDASLCHVEEVKEPAQPSAPSTPSNTGSSSTDETTASTTVKVDTAAAAVKAPENASPEENAAASAVSTASEKKDFQLLSGSGWTSSLSTTAASDSVKNNAEVKTFVASHAGENVTITVVPTVEVEVKAADAKALTYDITPKFNILLQAGSEKKLLEQSEKVPVTGTVTMQVPVPASFAGNGETLYIIHTLDNGTKKYYSGVIADGILTFLNPDGFSEFVITKDKPADFVDAAVTTVYRLYNPVSGEHLYTLDAHEVSVITTTQGWVDETKGSAPMTALAKDAEGGVPVYRFYCPALGHHFYTTNVYEKDVLKNNKDWNFEGIAFKSAPKGTGTAVYRLNKNGVAIHHYTNQKHEVDVLTSKNEWLDEGVAWYSFN